MACLFLLFHTAIHQDQELAKVFSDNYPEVSKVLLIVNGE